MLRVGASASTPTAQTECASRALAYLKLMEKYQEFNPFKFFIYGAQADQSVPQVTEAPLPQ